MMVLLKMISVIIEAPKSTEDTLKAIALGPERGGCTVRYCSFFLGIRQGIQNLQLSGCSIECANEG